MRAALLVSLALLVSCYPLIPPYESSQDCSDACASSGGRMKRWDAYGECTCEPVEPDGGSEP